MSEYAEQNTDDHPARATAPLILIVEDQVMLARLLAEQMRDFGYESIRAGTVAALLIARQAPLDVAILDVNLAGALSYPIAFTLCRRDIPVIFVTGYGCIELADEFPSAPVLYKPYSLDELAQALAAALAEPRV